jgi:hypothetical protein
MAPDPRVHYRAIMPIETKDGQTHWLRVGNAYKNPDGTIDIFFDVYVHGLRARLSEAHPADGLTTLPSCGAA